MWKTLSVCSIRSPWRLNECARCDRGGGLNEIETQLASGAWGALRPSQNHRPTALGTFAPLIVKQFRLA